jgi:hypothetical protein
MNSTKKTVFSASGVMLGIDWKKVFTGLLIALGGALATWLETDLLALIDFNSFGQWSTIALPIATALNGAIVNAIRKYIQSTTYIDQQ